MLPLNVLYSLMEESVWRRRRVPIMAIPSILRWRNSFPLTEKRIMQVFLMLIPQKCARAGAPTS